MGGDDALEIPVLMAVLMIFAPIAIFLAIPFFSGNVGGFDVQVEKTALYTESEIIPEPRKLTTDDLILSLLVADRYTPEPKKVRINVGGNLQEIAIDPVFLADKTPYLIQASSAIPFKVDMKLDLFVGNQGMRFWEASRP